MRKPLLNQQPLSHGAHTDNIQRRAEALKVNIGAGEGLQDVLKSNLGPSGTLKMYVSVFCAEWGCSSANKKLGWWTVQAEYVIELFSLRCRI